MSTPSTSAEQTTSRRRRTTALATAVVLGVGVLGAGAAQALTSPAPAASTPAPQPTSALTNPAQPAPTMAAPTTAAPMPSAAPTTAAPSSVESSSSSSSTTTTATIPGARSAKSDAQPASSVVDSSGTRLQEVRVGSSLVNSLPKSHPSVGQVSLSAQDQEAAKAAALKFLQTADTMDHNAAMDVWIDPALQEGLITQSLADERRALLQKDSVTAYWDAHMVKPGKTITPIGSIASVEAGSGTSAIVRVVYTNKVSAGSQSWESIQISQVYGLTKNTDGTWAVSSLPQVPMAYVPGASTASSSTTTSSTQARQSAAASARGTNVSSQQVVKAAENYLNGPMAFSERGLIKQLKFEKFSEADARAAIDILRPDFKAQAAKAAQSYIDTDMGFSEGGLRDQLKFEQYTPDQIDAGIAAVGLSSSEQTAQSTASASTTSVSGASAGTQGVNN